MWEVGTDLGFSCPVPVLIMDFLNGSAIYFDPKIDVNLFLNWANMSLCFYIKFVSVKRSTHLLVYRNCRKGGTLENCGGGGEKSFKANRLLKNPARVIR